jgi:hypothetical protein
MIPARLLNIATIIGYTGEIPPGWDLYFFDDSYPNRAAAHLAANNMSSGARIADMQNARWAPLPGSEPAFSALAARARRLGRSPQTRHADGQVIADAAALAAGLLRDPEQHHAVRVHLGRVRTRVLSPIGMRPQVAHLVFAA